MENQQRGLNAAAPAFTPSNFSRSVHSSQPNIGRRASCNPTFVTPTKLTRGNSLRATKDSGFGKQQKINQQQPANPENKKKEQATSFANEAFARKDAMKAFAAKKLAAQCANGDRPAETPEERMNRRLAAQKGFARRQSLKMNKRNSTKNNVKSTSIQTEHSTSSSDFKHTKHHQEKKNPDKENNPELSHHSSTTSSTAASSSTAPSTSSTLSTSETHSPDKQLISTSSNSTAENSLITCLSSVTDIDETPATSSLSIATVPSVIIPPGSPRLSIVSGSPPNALSRVHTCDIDISAPPRLSVASNSGPPERAPVISTSNGKWCPNCAGVGLHISALLTELAKQQRVDVNPRPTTGAGASGSLGAKTSWKRKMSQTIIGDRGASKAAAEQKRLQQQVDVLTTTVAFLYEKLQTADKCVDPLVEDAFNRCRVGR